MSDGARGTWLEMRNGDLEYLCDAMCALISERSGGASCRRVSELDELRVRVKAAADHSWCREQLKAANEGRW